MTDDTGKSEVPIGTLLTNVMNLQGQIIAQNSQFSRSSLAKQLGDPRRKINDDCGFPSTETITIEDYQERYDRNPVATRVVEIMPIESWQSQPNLVENDNEEVDTDFEIAWDEIPGDLGGKSLYKDEEVNPLWEYLRRVDVQSGIGRYGVLLLGFDDGKSLKEPVNVSGTSERKLLFLRVFSEKTAQITALEMRSDNPRFGMPTKYSLFFNNPQTQLTEGSVLKMEEVHWSRVIHVPSDNIESVEWLGVPRAQPVYNNLLSLEKLYGGSGEMYWRGAFPGLSIETHPELGGDVIIDKDDLRTQLEQYMNTLQRYIAIGGATINSLAPQVVDPSPQIEVQLDAICITTGVPKRIFVGSERGELASSQDKDLWNDRLQYRQVNRNTPRLIVPFVDRLIQVGVLPTPKQYKVVWPNINALNETVQSEVALRQTEAIVQYVGGDGQSLIQPADYLVTILGLPPSKVEEIIETTMDELDEQEELEEERMDEAKTEVMGKLQVEADRQKQEAKLAEQGITKLRGAK